MKVFPEALPSSVRSDSRRRAEVLVYEALAAQLGDPWVVFYSVPWIGRAQPTSRRADGEADFVIAHPELGLIAIEVKGGEIRVDRKGWHSIDRSGAQHNIKDPFQQATQSKHMLQDKIIRNRAWRGGWVRSAHAVIFPDVTDIKGDLRPHAPKDLVITASELPHLKGRLEQIAKAAQDAAAQPQADGPLLITVLIDLVARSIYLRNPLRYQIADEEAELLRLTEAQFDILYQLKNFRSAAISGCAGSGKTMLAVEKARRLARSGERTLLTCYNRPLADHLATITKDDEGLQVSNLHSLCRIAADRAGIDLPVGDEPSSVFEVDYPEALFEAMTGHRELAYDAVLVDEGQDIREGWWPAVESCLRDPATSTFYVFYDDNQTLYPNTSIPHELPVFPLNANVRNTRQIVDTLRPLHANGKEIEARGPTGRSIEAIACSPESAGRELERVLTRLISIESVRPQDIVVLTIRPVEFSSVRDAKVPPNIRLGGKGGGERTVLLDTVRRFKGLESAIAIIADLDQLTPDDKELLYVALSRPRSHVVLLGGNDIIQEIMAISKEGHG